MAIKTAIKTAFQTALSNTSGLSTWAKLESYLHTQSASLLENFYNTNTVSDTQATTNVFTALSSSKEYSFTIKKQGGKVHIIGSLTNATSGILSFEQWSEITSSEYYSSNGFTFFATSSTGGNVKMAFLDNDLIVLGTIGIGETIYINETYYVGQ